MMKDDNNQERNQSVNASSSSARTLELLNKEFEKSKEPERKEAAAEAGRVRCRSCFKEIAPVRRCFGHGGAAPGGEGSGSGASAEVSGAESDNSAMDASFEELDDSIYEWSEAVELGIEDILDEDLLKNQECYDPKIIEDLITKGLLLVNLNRELKTLTIELRCEPKELSEEQRVELKKFMQSVLNEYQKFKEAHKLSDDGLKIRSDKEGNILSLEVSFPKMELYDAFVKQLANNMTPRPTPELKKQKEARISEGEVKNPKPEDKIDNAGEAIQANEEDSSINPSPFNITPWK